MAIFNERHTIMATGGETLAFANSSLIKAYPCGARHATYTTNTNTQSYIPYDPEARLATESTSRKTAGSLGLPQKQSALVACDKSLKFYLNGYFFELESPDTSKGLIINQITDELMGILGTEITTIYANIIVQQVPLYYEDTGELVGELNYKTWVLRDQVQQAPDKVAADLDKMVEHPVNTNETGYYFSALSFSANPRAEKKDNAISMDGKTLCHKDIPTGETIQGGTTPAQQITSILLFVKNKDGEWQINQAALLPKIEHGAEENSVKLGKLELEDLNAENLYVANQIKLQGQQVPSIQVIEQGEGSGVYQLVFRTGPKPAE